MIVDGFDSDNLGELSCMQKFVSDTLGLEEKKGRRIPDRETFERVVSMLEAVRGALKSQNPAGIDASVALLCGALDSFERVVHFNEDGKWPFSSANLACLTEDDPLELLAGTERIHSLFSIRLLGYRYDEMEVRIATLYDRIINCEKGDEKVRNAFRDLRMKITGNKLRRVA